MKPASPPRRLGFVSLRRKLVRILLIAVAVPVVLVSAAITVTVDRLVRANGEAVLSEISDQIAARMTDYLADLRSTTLSMAYGHPIQNYLTGKAPDDSAVLTELMQIVESKRRTFAAYLYGAGDSDRKPVVVNLRHATPVDYRYEWSSDPFLTDLYSRPSPFGFVGTRPDPQVADASEPSFMFYRIIHDLSNGKQIGVMVVAIPSATIREAFGSLIESRNAQLVVAMGDGRVVYDHGGPGDTPIGDLEATGQRIYRDGRRIVAVRPLREAEAIVALSAPQARLSLSSGLVRLGLLLPITAVLAIMVIVILYLPAKISGPVVALARETEHIRTGDFVVRSTYASNDEIGELYSSFSEMASELDSLVTKVTAEEKRRARAELHALQSQITPHFVFNTLNSVKWLAQLQGAQSIVDVTGSLMTMMRYALEDMDTLVTVADEFENVARFLRIQEIRFFHSVDTAVDCSPECATLPVPRLVVQPLVENVFHHAFSELDEGGSLSVTCRPDGQHARIVVSDSAGALSEADIHRLRATIDAGRSDDAHVGVANVHQRVRATFGPPFGVAVNVDPGSQTTFTILIPGTGDGVDG